MKFNVQITGVKFKGSEVVETKLQTETPFGDVHETNENLVPFEFEIGGVGFDLETNPEDVIASAEAISMNAENFINHASDIVDILAESVTKGLAVAKEVQEAEFQLQMQDVYHNSKLEEKMKSYQEKAERFSARLAEQKESSRLSKVKKATGRLAKNRAKKGE